MSVHRSFFSRLLGKDGGAAASGEAEVLASPLAGRVIPLEEVSDQTFAQKILGDGLALEPAEGKVYSPVDGEVSSLMDSLHAICITSAGGAEILIHVGKDTVALNGGPFTAHVREGQKVKRGDLLLEFKEADIRSAGLELVTPVVVSNWQDYKVEKTAQGEVKVGDTLLTLRPRA